MRFAEQIYAACTFEVAGSGAVHMKTMSSDPQPSEIRSAPVANLDILRAIAVTIVLMAHFALTMSGNGPGQRVVFGVDLYTLGRTGVLIFFVHTSLVLMLSEGPPKEWTGAEVIYVV